MSRFFVWACSGWNQLQQWWQSNGGSRQQPIRYRSRQRPFGVEALEPRYMLSALSIVQENQLQGTPQSVWDVAPTTTSSIEGYATQISVNEGERVHFKVNTTSSDYRLDIYRLGYYGGNGARFIDSVDPSRYLPQGQAAPIENSTTGLVDAGNWQETASWDVPTDATSGVYIAKLVRQDGNNDSNLIVFVVRNDQSHSNLLFQTSDATWEAYNPWGGNDLYAGDPDDRAYAISYNRPFETRVGDHSSFLFGPEFSMIRYLEQNGYDVSYTTNVDTARRGSEILEHKVFLSVGHDEYWSSEQVNNVEAALQNGVNLAFFSGNEIYWKTRWMAGADGQDFRTMICYKESQADAKIDPTNIWTGTWRDPRFSPPADGGIPGNALSGTNYITNYTGVDGWSMQVAGQFAPLRFWRNTSIAGLSASGSATIAPYSVGYEFDMDQDNGFRPAGLFDLSSTTISNALKLADYGNDYEYGTATHNMTEYRAASGALVFGAGTIQYAYGLDSMHDGVAAATSPELQQATVNLFADMGVSAHSLMAGLIQTTATTDFTPPTSTLTAPAAAALVHSGVPVTISGTAADLGGGVVAAVEVSTDGGATWHPATGRNTWSYTWTPGNSGTVVIKSRAVDDSGNLETPSAGRSVSVTLAAGGLSFFGSGSTPGTPSQNDSQSAELGMKFISDVSGYVTSLMFYKGAGNTGTHSAHLWDSAGNLLASATFTNESGSGWQSVTFAQPVLIQAGQTYIASYFAPNGHYAADLEAFALGGVDKGPIHILQTKINSPNGVFSYGSSPSLPTDDNLASNYWVDIVFKNLVNSVTPADNAGSVATAASPTVTFTVAMDATTINANTIQLRDSSGNLVAAAVTYNATTNTATLAPTAALSSNTAYTILAKSGASGVKTQTGVLLGADVASQFVTAAATTTGTSGTGTTTPPGSYSLFGSNPVPAVVTSGDTQAVNLGMKFRADASGTISAIRFYKSAQNTGPHTVQLWSSTGTLLATGTSVNETASGWQTIQLSTPVLIQANTTYIATYFTAVGRYSVNYGYFTNTGVDSGPLHALREGVDGSNSVFQYGTTPSFPTQTYTSSNYWVDVVFNSFINSVTPAANATNVSVNATVSVTFARDMNVSTLNANTLQLRDAANNLVSTTISYNAATRTATLQPTAALANSTTYTFVIKSGSSGVKDTTGTALSADSTTNFTTTPLTTAAPLSPAIYSAWNAGVTPGTPDSGDAQPVELGVKFRTDINGYVTGLRFYKATANTGTHVGNLWSSTGTLLATATFTSESASGWQTVTFSQPVAIQANTTYIVSYYAPKGRYAATTNAFATAGVDNGPLHLLASGVDGANGIFKYGTGGGFPTTTGSSTNYWVDVMFVTPVTAITPTPGATNVAVNPAVTVQFAAAMDATSLTASTILLRDASGNAIPYTLAYNATTFTATLTPTASLGYSMQYNVTVKAGAAGVHLATGGTLGGDVASSFTTQANIGTGPFSAFAATALPGTPNSTDAQAVELGVKFRTDVDGYITSVRFYKGTQNTGTHVGKLYASDGTLLATATFTNESASGWQTVNFSTPVAVRANTTYIASYYAPVGHYSVNFSGFAAAGADNGPLHLLKNGVDGANSVYLYGAGTGFPTSTYSSSNYWVDVVFKTVLPPDTTPPTVMTMTPANNAANVATTASITVQFSEAMTAATISSSTIFLSDAGNNPVAATVTYNAATNTATLTPTSPLNNSATYSVRVKSGSAGVKDAAGNALAADFTSSFTTVALAPPAPPTPPAAPTASQLLAGKTPTTVDSKDSGAVELGVKFTSDQSGYISGISFYKATANTGTHVAHLWSANGTLLATGTFVNETASGWQQVAFAQPVAIQANTTYIASYYAPVGRYSVTSGGFLYTGVDSGPLHILAGTTAGVNSVFKYGAGGVPLTDSYNSSNYYVDVTFTSLVKSISPGNAAAGVGTTASLYVQFQDAINTATLTSANVQLRGPGNVVVATTIGYDAVNHTATITPVGPLANSTAYALYLQGGSGGIASTSGQTLFATSGASFTTAAAQAVASYSLFASTATPQVADSTDTKETELGVKFRADVSGYVIAIRFYKAAKNTGIHTGSLWAADGTLLGTVTFVSESASGWQTAYFSTPILIQANTTYIASYHAPVGRYSVNVGALSNSGVDSGLLHILPNGMNGPNGVFNYGPSVFPTNTNQSSNYWVDVLFQPLSGT